MASSSPLPETIDPRENSLQTERLIAAAVVALATLAAAPVHAQRVVAIAVNGPHPTLQQTEKGFREELVRQGFAEGRDIVFTQSMGNFNPALIPQLLAQAESRNPALLFTITTPVSQAARGVVKNQNLPIVFGIVSDPIKAGLVSSWDKGSDRYVGVSNLHDMEAVLAFGKSVFPNAKSMGLPFNPGEANDVAHTELARAAGAKLGLEVRAVAVDTVNDIAPRIQSLRGTDFIYVLPSNLLIPAAPAISAAASQINVPLIAASFPIVRDHGAVASYGTSYEILGTIAGRMAAEILRGRKPAELANHRPTAKDHEAFFSAKQMERYKVRVPDAYKACGNCVIQ